MILKIIKIIIKKKLSSIANVFFLNRFIVLKIINDRPNKTSKIKKTFKFIDRNEITK
tara:strand:- start:68 stop:238 length:171 start_codon:yes stop_codon:yes gene_type:complete